MNGGDRFGLRGDGRKETNGRPIAATSATPNPPVLRQGTSEDSPLFSGRANLHDVTLYDVTLHDAALQDDLRWVDGVSLVQPVTDSLFAGQIDLLASDRVVSEAMLDDLVEELHEEQLRKRLGHKPLLEG